MTKKSKTTTIHRMDPKKGNFVTMSRDILSSTELTDKAKVLLMLMLNNADNWNISVCYYGKLLGWGNTTLSNTVKNLVENGYLLTDKHSKGKGLGFLYTYVVSEFGNLNPNKTMPTKEEVKEFLDEQEQQFSEEPLQLEASSNEVAEATSETIIEITPEQINEFDTRLNAVLFELLKAYRMTDEFLIKIADFYWDEVNKDKKKALKYTSELMRKQIINSIQRNEAVALKQIEEWIEIHNTKCTAIQRKEITNKTIKYFKERWEHPLEIVKEKDVEHRVLVYQTEIIGANRVHDSRFQD